MTHQQEPSAAPFPFYRTAEQRMPAHWQRQRTTANGMAQHYYRTGSGDKPPLLLLHGLMTDGLSWLRVAAALEHEYDIIMPDARGHGRSDPPGGSFTPELLTSDVIALIAALGLQQPVLLGHSMGAATAAQVAATMPQPPRVVVLEDPPVRAMPFQQMMENPQYQAWYQSWLVWMQSLQTQINIATSFTFLPPAARGWSEDDLVSLLEGMSRFNPEVFRLSDPTAFATTWQNYLAHITCPILLMTGSPAHGGLLAPGDIEQLAAHWQRGEHVLFAEASHFINRDAFEQYIEVVRAFLQKHAAA